MVEKIRVLMVEDSTNDAKLILYALKQYGFMVEYQQVQDASCMQNLLQNERWDVIISDYSMPQFSGEAALEILNQSGQDVPFILVSGQVGEETAVSLMKSGASDFVMKNNIRRLPSAIERELREVNVRRKRAQAEVDLASQRILMETILEQAAEAIVVCNQQGEIIFANPAAQRITRQPDLESLKSNLYWGRETTLDGREVPQQEWTIPRALRGDVIVGQEVHLVRDDGTCFDVLVNGAPLKNASGSIIGTVSVFTDISALRQAEEKLRLYATELERSNRELKEFASIASHDLKEPLRKVKVFGEMLVKHYQSQLGEDGKEYIQRMVNASVRMEDMINGLLTYSRISTRGNPFTQVDLGKVADEVLVDLEVLITQARGNITVDPLPVIEADPLQMRQLLQNLIGNALKFHQRSKPAEVKVWAEIKTNGGGPKPMICLHVQDNGIGFDEQDLQRMFQPFQRLHGRSEYEGTGMGLAICHKIVERHQGSITARSKPGEGATFMIHLPLNQPAARSVLEE